MAKKLASLALVAAAMTAVQAEFHPIVLFNE